MRGCHLLVNEQRAKPTTFCYTAVLISGLYTHTHTHTHTHTYIYIYTHSVHTHKKTDKLSKC